MYVTDHTGKQHKSTRAMCRDLGINYARFYWLTAEKQLDKDVVLTRMCAGQDITEEDLYSLKGLSTIKMETEALGDVIMELLSDGNKHERQEIRKTVSARQNAPVSSTRLGRALYSLRNSNKIIRLGHGLWKITGQGEKNGNKTAVSYKGAADIS